MTLVKRALLYVSRGGKIRVCGWRSDKRPKWYCVVGGGAPEVFRFSNRVLTGAEFNAWFRFDRATNEFVLTEQGQFEASLL